MSGIVAGMIKASGRTADGTPVLYLSLSGENMDSLAVGEAVVIPAAEAGQLGLPEVEVILRYSKDGGAAILEELSAQGLSVDAVMWPGDDAAV